MDEQLVPLDFIKEMMLELEKKQLEIIYETYCPSETVVFEGDSIESIGIITKGLLKAVNYTMEGIEVCNTYFTENEMFPEYLYFTGKASYSYTMTVIKKATIAWIKLEDFEKVLNKDKAMMYTMIQYMSKRGLKNQLMLHCLYYQTVRSRLAYWLVEMNEIEEGDFVRVPSSQEVLANLLHVSRSMLNQEVKKLEQEQFLELEHKKIKILNLEGLKELF